MKGSFQRQFWRNNLFVGLGAIAGQLQGIVLIPIVVKFSGTAAYGAYLVTTSVLLLTMTISSLGIGFRYRRGLPSTDDPAERAKLFLPGVIGQTVGVVIGCALVALCFPLFARLFLKDIEPLRVWLVPAFCVATVVYNQGCDYFRYTHRVGVFSFVVFFTSLLIIAAYVVLAWSGIVLKLDVLIGVQVTVNALVASVLWTVIGREIPLRCSILRLPQYLDDARLGFPLVLSTIAEMVTAVADRYVIALWLTAEAVGEYGPAFTIGSVILFIPRVSGVVLPPLLARVSDSADLKSSDQLVRSNIRLLLLLGVPAIGGSALLAKPMLAMLANSTVAETGRWIVPLIALSSLNYGLAMILNGILFVERRTHVVLFANLAALAVKVVLSAFALAFGLGLVGVAGATLVGATAAFIVILTDLKQSAVWFDAVLLARLLGATAIMMIVVVGAQPLIGAVLPAGLALITLILLGIVSYSLSIAIAERARPRVWAA